MSKETLTPDDTAGSQGTAVICSKEQNKKAALPNNKRMSMATQAYALF